MHGLVTVFGGSGFVGKDIVRALARRGFRVRVAVRNTGRGYKLRMLGDVGQVEIVQANIRDEASCIRALDQAEACVNAVGILYESGRQGFESLHAEGAARLAAMAERAGATRFVQISAIGADAASESIYARTKAAGEQATAEAFPGATVLRPSIVFGPDDSFFNRFAAMAQIAPALPLIGGGGTRFQPVFVGDVGQAVAACLEDAATTGRTFELGGPGIYTFRQLMEMTLEVTKRRRMLVPVPFGAASLIGRAGELAATIGLPPPLTRDQVVLLKSDNIVAAGAAGFAELGITPQALEPILPTYLYRYRRGGQYAELTARAAGV